jgi:signal transduction histidine kinase
MISNKEHINSIDEVILEIDKLSKTSQFGAISEDYKDTILSTFYKIDSVKSISFFEMNEEEFQFEIYKTIPKKESIKHSALFEELVDNNILGRALQTGRPIIFPEVKEKDIEDNIVIVPLASEGGITGITLLSLENHWESETTKNLGICRLFANYFSNIMIIDKKNQKIDYLELSFEQRLSEKLVDQSKVQNELNTFLDALQTGIFISSLKTGIIFRANPVAAKLTGYNELELSKMKIQDFLEQTNNIIGEHFETNLINRQGDRIPILRKNQVVTIKDTEYQIDSFLDITEIKKANDTLKDVNKLLEDEVNKRTLELRNTVLKLNDEIRNKEVAQQSAQKERGMNQLKSKFLATVSHEFRTPLTIIRNSAELLAAYGEKMKPDDKTKYLTRVVQTSDYLSIVLQNILYLQDQSGQVLGSSSFEANLNDVIKEVMEQINFSSQIRSKFVINLPENPIVVKHSKGVVKNLINNIINNSMIYNRNDNEIIITVSESEGLGFIVVEDEGIGIPEEDIAQIFELFYRGSNVGNIPGVGLGLAVAQHCLNLLGGTIEVQSKLNEGTKVLISLPKEPKLTPEEK